ncbi:MAG: hypothetical protein WC683_01460 [bacterium]
MKNTDGANVQQHSQAAALERAQDLRVRLRRVSSDMEEYAAHVTAEEVLGAPPEVRERMIAVIAAAQYLLRAVVR